MNWTLLTTIFFTLASPFNIGLAFNNDTEIIQAEFSNVQTQKEEQAVRVEGTLRPGESFKGPDGIEVIALDGALDEPAEIFIERVDDPTSEYAIELDFGR